MLREVEKIEIVTLQDNYIDITAADNSHRVTRARKLMKGVIGNSVLAEHGFSAFITTTAEGGDRSFIFDFGFSSFGAAHNARILNIPMGKAEALVLSHGHYDHFGGFEDIVRLLGKKEIDLILHPGAFKGPRLIKMQQEVYSPMPMFSRERAEKAGVSVVTTKSPLAIIDGSVLFLGEIERSTSFEKRMPNAFCEACGEKVPDPIEDDSSIVMHLKGKGLVIISGCAHSGIINTVRYAKRVTGIERIHAVMGGFHLGGPFFEPQIEKTTESLKEMDPSYIIPCHCTGRKAILFMESKMPEKFIVNMSGTKLVLT